MPRFLPGRQGSSLRSRLERWWAERASRSDPVVMLERKRHLVDHGTSYGLEEVRELEHQLRAVDSTLGPTVERELWTLLDGSEDPEAVEELVDGILRAELQRAART